MTDDNTIIERLSAIQRTIPWTRNSVSGFVTAYSDEPKSLPGTDLPAFINYNAPSSTSYSKANPGTVRIQTSYEMRLHVARIDKGVTGELESNIKTLVPLVEEAFFTRQRLQLDDAGIVAEALIQSVDKVAAMQFAGINYGGAVFTIQVSYLKPFAQV